MGGTDGEGGGDVSLTLAASSSNIQDASRAAATEEPLTKAAQGSSSQSLWHVHAHTHIHTHRPLALIGKRTSSSAIFPFVNQDTNGIFFSGSLFLEGVVCGIGGGYLDFTTSNQVGPTGG